MTSLSDVLVYIEQHSGNTEELTKIKKRCNEHLKVERKNKQLIVRESLDPEAIRIAEYIWDEVKQRYTFQKDSNVLAWAKEIQAIKRKYKEVNYELIMGVAQWAQHDTFWKQQIRSGAALARHFEKLLVQIKGKTEVEEMIRA